MTLSFVSKVIEIDEFGAGVLEATPEELAEKGFELGDTMDFAFSNGVLMENVPYYNGYYVTIGEPVFVAYPTYRHPSMNINCKSLQEETGINVGDTVTITMHEKGGKKSVMDLRGVVYSNDPKDYATRDRFANAREVRVGKMAPKKFYRCATPYDHMMNRPEAVSAFLEEHQVQTTISMSESEESLKRRYAGMPPYSKTIYENGRAIPLGLGSGYFSDDFCHDLTQGLIRAMDKPLPWAIHCMEGKDRTGFACALIGALMGGTYQELVDDYMITYDNYYGITEESDPFRCNGFKETFIVPYLRIFAGLKENEDPKGHDYSKGAADYLRRGGMTDEQIERFKSLLS